MALLLFFTFDFIDIDECLESSHKCDHNCHNTIGSYTCSCKPGYKLEQNKLSCQGLFNIFPPYKNRKVIMN